jgi:hypothetical protein
MNSGPVMRRTVVTSESGTRLPLALRHVELADIVDVRARVAFGFDIGLPLAAEAVEVVDQRAAHEGLHGGVDIAERETCCSMTLSLSTST